MYNSFSPSFKSKIDFVTNKEFLKHTNGEYIGAPWTVDQIVIGKDAYTDDCGPCQIGGLNNSEKMMFFHTNSCMSDFIRLEDKFISKSEQIEPDPDGINGLMTGGIMAKYTDFSIKMFRRLYPILKGKAGNNLSIIWGQCQNRRTNNAYNLEEDTWYINCEHNGLDNDAIFTVDDINKTYALIHISDKDEVYLNGRKIDKSELNQRSYEEIEEMLRSL